MLVVAGRDHHVADGPELVTLGQQLELAWTFEAGELAMPDCGSWEVRFCCLACDFDVVR